MNANDYYCERGLTAHAIRRSGHGLYNTMKTDSSCFIVSKSSYHDVAHHTVTLNINGIRF